MEHTNLFLFENQSALETKYPNGNVDDVEPGVAYARPAQGEEYGTAYYNRMVTNYSITIHSKDRSGTTVAADYTIQTPNVLDGNDVRMNVVASPVEGYKPRYATEKVEFTSASTEHTIIYLAATSYTVTVHHKYSGETIAEDTEILVENVFEEDVVRVKVEPETVSGYKAEAVYISVSGDMEYTLEYQEDICYVDLGLPSGTLWACKNLGASTPYEPGIAVAWGELTSKTQYDLENYKFYEGAPAAKASSCNFTKYSNCDDKDILDLEDDAANVAYGGGWHIPTPAQVNELINNTNSSDEGDYVVLTSRVNGKSIIFPYYLNTEGVYRPSFWTNQCWLHDDWGGDGYAYRVTADDDIYFSYKYFDYPVRPVLGEGPIGDGDDNIAI